MKKLPILATLSLLPDLALAHGGHATGTMLAAVLHPVAGVDHITVFVALAVLTAGGVAALLRRGGHGRRRQAKAAARRGTR